MNTQTIDLDVSKKPSVAPVVYLGQGDKNGTTLRANIYDNGAAMQLSAYTVRFSMLLPDGETYYSVNGSKSGSTATFTINETYAATVKGRSETAYVEVLSGTSVICSTNRFTVIVLRSAQDGADPSTAYSNGIIEATERANAAAEAAEGVVLDAVPLMSATVRGGAQLGDGLAIRDGKLTIDSETNIPVMSENVRGGAKVGFGLEIVNGDVLQVDSTEIETSVDGKAISPASVSATGEVTAIDLNDVTHALTQKLNTADYRQAYTWGEAKDNFTWGSIRGDSSTTGSTTTSNLGLTKPGYGASLDVAALNDDMDIIDAAVGDVDTATDGSLQAQVDTLRDSVDQLLVRVTRTVTNATFAANAVSYIYGDTLAGYAPIAMYFNFTNMSGYTSLVPSAAQTNGTNTYARVYNGGSSASTGSYVSTTILMKV